MSQIHQPHSKFVISTLKERIEFAKAILELTLPEKILNEIDLDRLRIEDGTFIGKEFREDRTDILFSVPGRAGGKDRKIYLLFEHKSEPDPDILEQLLRYLFAIYRWLKVKVGVRTVVFYHGVKEWNIPRSLHEEYELSEQEIEEHGHEVLNYQYRLLDVSRMDVEGLRHSLAFRCFLNILAWIWNFEDPERISEFLDRYRELFFEESEREFIKKLVRYIFGTRNLDPDLLEDLIQKHVSPELGYLAMTTAEILQQEKALEVAKKLLAKGVELEVVLESTDLTLDQLKEAKIIS